MAEGQAVARAKDLLIRHLPEILKGIIAPRSFSAKLFSRFLIPHEVYNNAIGQDASTENKKHAICQALLSSIESEPPRVVDFVELASDHSLAMGDVCARIKREPLYGEPRI